MDHPCFSEAAQEAGELSWTLRAGLVAFLAPLLTRLDPRLDPRLVRTVADTVAALICWRKRAHGLLLSELGAYILSPWHAPAGTKRAPAGTKRLSTLLRSSRWSGACIERFLWSQADAQFGQIAARRAPRAARNPPWPGTRACWRSRRAGSPRDSRRCARAKRAGS